MSKPLRSRREVLALGVMVVVAVAAPSPVEAAEVLEFATLAPKESPLGRALTGWTASVKEKSGGRLELRIAYGGQHGDEAACVAKVRGGQLAGAALSGVGLGVVHQPIAALQMPGLFASWAGLDAARDAVKGELEKGAGEAGFTVLGWYDLGRVRAFGRGVGVRLPRDLKGRKPWQRQDDPNVPALFEAIGGVTGVRLGLLGVGPALNAGQLDVVFTTAAEAEQHAWSSSFDKATAEAFGVAIGGLVVSRKRLEALPADLRAVLLETSRATTAGLLQRMRTEDDAAWKRLSGRLTSVPWADKDRELWAAHFKLARQRLAQSPYSADLVSRLEALAR